MEDVTIFEDISSRTGGNIYISAVGPVADREIDIYQKVYGFGGTAAHYR